MTFTVDVLSSGRTVMPGPEAFWMQGWDEWLDSNFWLVLARDGRHTVLINTGPLRDIEALNSRWRAWHPSGQIELQRDESELPEAGLARLGVDPAEVTHVVLTPLVEYTVGNLQLFPNATFVISRRGWVEDIFAPPHPPHLSRQEMLPDDVMSHLLFEASNRIRLVQDEEIVPGVRVWEAGVHHRASLAVCIDTSVGTVIATDTAFFYRNVEANVPIGIGESYAEAMTTYARLRDEADVLLPLFDPAVLERHPGGRVA